MSWLDEQGWKADGSRLFEGTIKMQDFRNNPFLGRTTNKWLFEATLKPHYKTFFSLTIILCNVIFASSSSYGAGRHLCQEKESPQLDGWVVVGWDEVAILEFLLTTRCANSVNVVSKGNLGRHMKTYHCVPIRFWAFLWKPQDGASIQRFKEAREEISFWRTGSLF